MKKIFLIIIAFVNINAMGQKLHKAMGYMPSSSERYIGFLGDDSTLVSKSTYMYNANQQLIKEIAVSESYTDSIITSYDASNRIVSVLTYRNNALYHSKLWVYDEQNHQVTYCERALLGFGGLDTIIYSIYKGVRDFDGDDNPLSPLLNLLFEYDFVIEIELRDCDSIFVYTYDPQTTSLNLFMEIQPAYLNGKPASAQMNLMDFYMDFGDITVNLDFTYDGDKLMNANGSTTITFGIPIEFPDAISLINQYTDELLIETKVEMRLIYSPFIDMYMGGTIQKYGYNSEDNLAFIIKEYSDDGTDWLIDSKTYYSYNDTIDGVEDIALVMLNKPSGLIDDTIGTSIHIEVILENKSRTTTYNQVNITALIINSQGNPMDTISEIIDAIPPDTIMKYTFTEAYVVPDDSLYTIIVFIDSQDDNPFNDTLETVRTTPFGVGIKTINNNIYFDMHQNFPNPVKDITLINYTIPTDGKIQFTVYNLNGQLIFFQSEDAKSGENTLKLPVSNLTSGIYFYSMEYNGKRIVRKMNVR